MLTINGEEDKVENERQEKDPKWTNKGKIHDGQLKMWHLGAELTVPPV